MLRRTTKLFSSFFKIPVLNNVSKKSLIYTSLYHNSTQPQRHFTSAKPTKIQLIINNLFLKVANIHDIMGVYDKFKQQMNLVNLSVMLKHLTDKEMIHQTQSLPPNITNEILQRILFQLEREDLSDSRLVSSLYFYLSRLPITNNEYKSRCNVLLECQGMMLYREMNSQNITNFLYALAQNKNAEYFDAMIPFLAENIPNYNLRTLVTILYDCCLLDIKGTEYGNKFQDFFSSQPIDTKMNTQDYSMIFYYCGKNPEIMNKPEFFAKLEALAKFQAHFCNGIALTNIFHGLSFYDKPMVSAEFYTLFESRILNLLPELTNQALSLILRGYSTFGFGSDRFYQKIMEEACKRINKLDLEAFSTILYHLAQADKVSVTMLALFTKRLVEGDIDKLTSKQFEHVFYAFFNLLKDDLYQPDRILLDNFRNYIVKNIHSFTFQELGNLAHMLKLLLPKEYHEELSKLIQEKIIKGDSLSLDSTDLKSLCEIVHFVTHEPAAPFSLQFAKKFLDLGVILAEKKLAEAETKPTLHFLRYYGKLLMALTFEMDLSTVYKGKKKQLRSLIEESLVKYYNFAQRVPEDLKNEDILMSFIIPFYSLKPSPSDQTKNILREALKSLRDPVIKRENRAFINDKTDLWAETAAPKRRKQKSKDESE